MVWQGPRLGFVAESGRFVTMNALSTISCFCALLPTFLVFSFLIPVCFIFFVFLRLSNSNYLVLCSQQVRILWHVLFSRNSFVFIHWVFSGSSYLSGDVCCALVAGTLARDLPTSLIYRILVFLSLTRCDHRIYISLGSVSYTHLTLPTIYSV